MRGYVCVCSCDFTCSKRKPQIRSLDIPRLTFNPLYQVCIAVAIVRKLRTPSNLLIVSLAVADMLVAILVMPFAITYEVREVAIIVVVSIGKRKGRLSSVGVESWRLLGRGRGVYPGWR